MTDLEDALELRDKILSAAPSIYQTDDEIMQWANALLLAKSYYNVEQPDIEDMVLRLFRSNFCVQYISYLLDISAEEVIKYLHDASIPAIIDNEAVSMDMINALLYDDEVSEKFHEIADKVRELSESLHYKLQYPSFSERVDYNVLDKMLKDGYSYGDFSQYASCQVKYILLNKMRALRTPNINMFASVIEDWMCGKSALFLMMKYNLSLKHVKAVLHTCGYATLVDEDCTIHSVNDNIRSRSGRLECTSDVSKLSREYLTLPSVKSADDIAIISRMRSLGYSTEQIEFALGGEL